MTESRWEPYCKTQARFRDKEREKGRKAFIKVEGQGNFNYSLDPCKSEGERKKQVRKRKRKGLEADTTENLKMVLMVLLALIGGVWLGRHQK